LAATPQAIEIEVETGGREINMAVFKRGKKWWYKFVWNGELIRESTKQSNKRTAEQMEAAHKASLAKGEVGIRERTPAPTLKDFAQRDFLPFVRSTSAGKPRTVTFYETTVANVTAFGKLASLRLDAITPEMLADFASYRRAAGMQISTINRDLATVRRIFHLAQEWGRVSTVLPRVRLLPGERQRERVLTAEEEEAYLEAALTMGREIEDAYRRALEGIRATKRGKQPIRPDAYMLRDVSTVLFDCGLRPEECHRLRWENIRDGGIEIFTGKRKASRRRIPVPQRVLSILEMRRAVSVSDWVFPADTKTGHIETGTLKKQHRKALIASKVPEFVPYDLRHTCLTRWAKAIDPFTLKRLAGHADLNTTMRYVHMNDEDVRAAMKKAQGGHKNGHTADLAGSGEGEKLAANNSAAMN
jgi:integrase